MTANQIPTAPIPNLILKSPSEDFADSSTAQFAFRACNLGLIVYFTPAVRTWFKRVS